jgi:hypothetical protein
MPLLTALTLSFSGPSTRSSAKLIARSRSSSGYFLGAGTAPLFRGFSASTRPGAVHPRTGGDGDQRSARRWRGNGLGSTWAAHRLGRPSPRPMRRWAERVRQRRTPTASARRDVAPAESPPMHGPGRPAPAVAQGSGAEPEEPRRARPTARRRVRLRTGAGRPGESDALLRVLAGAPDHPRPPSREPPAQRPPPDETMVISSTGLPSGCASRWIWGGRRSVSPSTQLALTNSNRRSRLVSNRERCVPARSSNCAVRPLRAAPDQHPAPPAPRPRQTGA